MKKNVAPLIAQEIPWLAGRIVLYAYDVIRPLGPVKQSSNIQMLDHNDLVLWTINGMKHSPYGWSEYKPETFVFIYRDGDVVYANTFAGHVFLINPKNGLATYSGFAK